MLLRASIIWLSMGLAAAAIGGCAYGSMPTAVRAPQVAEGESVPRMSSQAVVRARTIEPGREEGPAGPAFEYQYLAPKSPALQPIYKRVREADLLHRLPAVQQIDGMFQLPRPLRYVTAECDEFGAFYVPETNQVVLCYETLRTLYERGQMQQKAGGLDPDYPLRYTRANVRFIVLHETGHALVDLLDLPITRRC